MNPGLSLSVEPVAILIPCFGIGGHFDFAWLGVKKPKDPPPDFRSGVDIFEVSQVLKAILPLSELTGVSLELSPGYALAYSYLHYSDPYAGYGESATISQTELLSAFSLSTAISVWNNLLSLSFHYKNNFDKNGHYSWLKIAIGISAIYVPRSKSS